MAFATPAEIKKAATGVYHKYLRSWIDGATIAFFPYRMNVSRTLDRDQNTARQQLQTLLSQSKPTRKRGYTVELEEKQSRIHGRNKFPKAIWIETLDDLLYLANSEEAFAATCRVVTRVRQELPELEPWLQKKVKTLYQLADRVEGLIAVASFFKENPTREHHLRELPVHFGSKFAEKNTALLDAWLQHILPLSSIDFTQKDFSRRYGLQVVEDHWMLRVLDRALLSELELPFGNFSLPIASIATLPLHDVTILVTENRIPLLKLPELPRTIALWGQGNAVVQLHSLKVLHECRLLYWGDLDVEGFQILSRFRAHFPHTESVLMDAATLEEHLEWKVDGTGATCEVPENLTPEERVAFGRCVRENWRVEQERIGQDYLVSILE